MDVTHHAAAPPLLRAEEIRKRYGATTAVDGVSFDLDAGEVLAIVGENGAGKSTLVRCLSGLERPDSGHFAVDGRRISADGGPVERLRLGISLAPQELTLCPNLSVAENISLGQLPVGHYRFVDWDAVEAFGRDRMAMLGVEAFDVRRRLSSIGVAEKAFVQMARAVQEHTRVLIVDEPTAPLSGDEVEQLLGVIRSLADRGVAIIYISHRLDEVIDLCTRALVLRDGRRVADFTRSEITAEQLTVAMIGDLDLAVEPAPTPTPGSAPARLAVRGLSGGRVRCVDLTIGAGEVVAIYGVLGSGREEIGALIAGARPARSGRVEVDGRVVDGGISAAIAAGLGYVPAERRSQGLALGLSVRANLELAMLDQLSSRRLGLMRGTDERVLASEWLERLGITAPSVEAPVGVLSGGNQQKVLIARSLASGCRVLVLEEPTRGVDIATKSSIYRVLQSQAARGSAILVVSSDIEEVCTVAQRVIVLAQGSQVAELRGPAPGDVAAAALEGMRTEQSRV